MTHSNVGVPPSRLAAIAPENLSPAQQALVAAVEQGPRAQKHGRIGALAQRVGDRDRIFVHVQPDEQRCRLRHG